MITKNHPLVVYYEELPPMYVAEIGNWEGVTITSLDSPPLSSAISPSSSQPRSMRSILEGIMHYHLLQSSTAVVVVPM